MLLGVFWSVDKSIIFLFVLLHWIRRRCPLPSLSIPSCFFRKNINRVYTELMFCTPRGQDHTARGYPRPNRRTILIYLYFEIKVPNSQKARFYPPRNENKWKCYLVTCRVARNIMPSARKAWIHTSKHRNRIVYFKSAGWIYIRVNQPSRDS